MNLNDKKILVLNGNYIFLDIATLKKVLVWHLKGKINILSFEESECKSIRFWDGKIPCVVVLNYIAKIPYKVRELQITKKNVLDRDQHTCQYCGKKIGRHNATIDHIIPKSRIENPNTWKNLVAACAYCNHKKDDRTPEEAGMKLIRLPFKPKLDFILKEKHGFNEKWKEFLKL
jgi:5-methylcytosine-specific restriction endonuclease McrA